MKAFAPSTTRRFTFTLTSKLLWLAFTLIALSVLLSLGLYTRSGSLSQLLSRHPVAASPMASQPVSAAAEERRLPTLQGEKAVAYLQQAGLSASLGDAMREARYGVK